QTATRPAKSLVGRCRREVRVGNGRRMLLGGDEPRYVRHVHHQLRAHGIRNLAESGKVDDAWVAARARDDELRPVLLGEALNNIIIDAAGFQIDAVVDGPVEDSGEVDRGSMGK